MKRIDNDTLLKVVNNRKVLIIGNSPNIKKHRLKNIIDNNDFCVIRFNNWKLDREKNKEYIGTKTDIFCMTTSPTEKAQFYVENEYCIRLCNTHYIYDIIGNCISNFIAEGIECIKDIYTLDTAVYSEGHIYSSGLLLINFFIKNGIIPYIHGFTLNDDENSQLHTYAPTLPEKITKFLGIIPYLHDFKKEKKIIRKYVSNGDVRLLTDIKIYGNNKI